MLLASLDLAPLLKDYTVTTSSPMRCIDLTILPNNIVTQDFHRISFSLKPVNISSNVMVDTRTLTYDIQDSDSKLCY